MIDSVRINFDNNSLWLLNLCLAIIMFGVALNLTTADFARLLKAPKSAIVGVISQFLVLPFITFLLILVVEPIPSLALGMMLVAACPGGNISNFMTANAQGNIALSVSLTAFSTFGAIIFTPLNVALWGSLYEPTAQLLQTVEVNILQLIQAIFLILGAPLVLGMLFRAKYEKAAARINKWLKPISILIFIGFVVIAFAKNMDIFLEYFQYIIYLVFVHNAVAFFSGYSLANIFKLPNEDVRSITIETGIQNSGLGLLLIFSFFDGLGGMAMIAAWWGIWHIISGLILSSLWAWRNSHLQSA